MMKQPPLSTLQDSASAHAAYCQRLAELTQESQQRWLDLGRRLAGDGAGQCLSTLAPLKIDGAWQEIAPTLGEATRKQWQCQLEASQAIIHTALEDQATLAAGISEAISDWLRNASTAANGSLSASPLTRMWATFSDHVSSACAAMREASQSGARHGC